VGVRRGTRRSSGLKLSARGSVSVEDESDDVVGTVVHSLVTGVRSTWSRNASTSAASSDTIRPWHRSIAASMTW
jgi:hypothetical protein